MSQAKVSLVHTESSFQRASCYFAAHPDDWQLFMNPSAFLDVLDKDAKVILVHMTAGDAGLGVGTGGRKQPYYKAREHGAEMACRFMADVADSMPGQQITSSVRINEHSIWRIQYRNTVSYFLRLPDGSCTGAGYPQTHHQSLQRLANHDIERCSTIDESTVYHGWADLVVTLRELIACESKCIRHLDLHIPEIDTAINPDDHPDHLATAKAVLEAVGAQAEAHWFYHVGYASAALPENIASHERDMKSAVFAVTVAGVLAFDHGAAWRHYDQAYVGRNYFRTESIPALATR